MIQRDLEREILSSLSPDGWKDRWSQVNRFGGGHAVECEVGELLHSFVRATKPNVVVETGTHKGFSSLMIAAALKQNGSGRLYTIDLEDHGVNAELAKFGFGSIATFIKGDGKIVIKELVSKVGAIDFLFLDADHSTESVLSEFEAGRAALRPGSYIAFHDSLTDVREAAAVARIVQENPRWQHLHFTTARGFDIVRVT